MSTFSLGLGTNVPLVLAVVGTFAIQVALVYVPALQPIFGTAALGIVELAVVLAASTLAFVAVEFEKAWFRGRDRRQPTVGQELPRAA
jgi:P-type Ca2+ transporter type 2C